MTPTPPRIKREFTAFCQQLSATYPQAERIRLALDNLNTRHPFSFAPER